MIFTIEKRSRVSSASLLFSKLNYSTSGVSIGPGFLDVVTTSATVNISSSATGFVYFTVFHLT